MPARAPAATVVVDARNGDALLERCLRSLAAQAVDTPAFEVIAITRSSSATGIDTPFPLHVREAETTSAGLPLEVAATAEGAVCIFLGADVAAQPGLVSAHVSAHRRRERLLGLGRVTLREPTEADWFARAAVAAWNARNEPHQVGWTDADPGNFSVARAAVAAALQRAEPRAWKNAPMTELAYELSSAGYTTCYLRDAHGVRLTEARSRSLLAQRSAEGAAHAQLVTARPEATAHLLGRFTDTTPREVLVRRLLLVLGLPARLLARLGPVLPDDDSRRRWFVLLSNLEYWRAVRRNVTAAQWKRLARGIPVLLYHAFSTGDDGGRFTIGARVFRRQMRLLSLLRWRVVAYDELVQSLQAGTLPAPRTAVLTIDDGYTDNAEIAVPILERHAFSATIFLVSGRLGRANDWSDGHPLRGRPILAAAALGPLRRRGVDIGAHTVTHPDLPELSEDAIANEVRESREQLERALGAPVPTFAYPYGRYDERVVAAVRDAGFASACTTEPRLARADDDPFLVPRIEIKGGDSLWRFLAKVWLGST